VSDGATAPALFVLPEELAIDTGVAKRLIAEFIRGQLRQAGFERAVLGLSGGIDSALVAYLTADAIGAERLHCVLMPYRTSSPASREDAEEVVRRLGCSSEVVDISPMVDGYFGADGSPGAAGPEGLDAAPLRRGNFMARMRMSVLYDRSVTWRGLVVGTGNKTESLIGYTTLFGDQACAFNPVGDLYKSQVRQLSAALGVPEQIIRKAPSADLWPGQTDETEAGFSYPELDRLLFWRIDKRRSVDEVVALGYDRAMVERVDRMVAGAEFKRQVPPIAKLGPPASTTSIRAAAPAPRAPERGRRHAVRRRDADRQPRRRHAPRARGAPGGAADRGGGHPGLAPAARPVRDPDPDRQLPRAERPGPGARAARPSRGRG
jgi:NAD+ synthase